MNPPLRLPSPLARAAFPVLFTAVLLPRLAPAAPTAEERFAALERRLETLESENRDLRRQLGTGENARVTAAGRESTLAVGGFVHANYEAGGSPDARFNGINDRFLLRRARLAVSGTFAEKVSFKVESDFGNNSISPKSGASGQLTDYFVAWTRWPAASLRFGQFKSPFGAEQLYPDTKLITVERGLANDRLTLGRQLGLAAFGEALEKRFTYTVGAFNGTGTNSGSNDSDRYLWAGRATMLAYDGRLAGQKFRAGVGVNGFTTADKGTFTGRRIGSGADLQVNCGPAEIVAEVLRNDWHPVAGRPTAAAGWSLLGRFEVTRHWQGVLRYEEFTANTAVPGTTTLWTYGVNYLLKGDDLKLSLNWVQGRPPAPAPDAGRFLSRVQVAF